MVDETNTGTGAGTGTGTNTGTNTGTGTLAGIGGGSDPDVLGYQGSVSPFFGPYVGEMLGRGQALASQPYQAYTGPLTAGTSGLQQQAFSGLASLAVPTEQMGAFTQERAQELMNPYLQQIMQPRIDEQIRQFNIQRLGDLGKLTRAGAYGGTRQALMEGERARGLQSAIAGITGETYRDAYDKALQAQQDINRYGLDALQAQREAGAEQRAIEQAGVTADILQFEEERDFPYKQVQYMQSLLSDMPVAARETVYSEPNQILSTLETIGKVGESLGLTEDDLLGFVKDVFSGSSSSDLYNPDTYVPPDDELEYLD